MALMHIICYDFLNQSTFQNVTSSKVQHKLHTPPPLIMSEKTWIYTKDYYHLLCFQMR